ncbi:interferon regulatory factor 1-like [Stylophora pistillata]|uniref:interferon regulatory factor 1-like n=1 Tax=Stylophora pistillata TaxID=50429 RepID=UPI000C03FEA1|nr:interferon regulatory factor 1-like [Stylophora pistillata]
MLSKKMRLSSVGVDRSLVRGASSRVPKERKRFTPWLEEQIEEGDIDGLEWIEKDKGIFKVPWVRVDKPEFVLETHAELFKRWAEHTGKYRKGDQPDPSTWKTRFRCALRKMNEIVEIRELGSLEGSKPYRAFKFEPKLKDRSSAFKRSPGKRSSRPPSLESLESNIPSPMEPVKGTRDHLPLGRMLNHLQICEEYPQRRSFDYRNPDGSIIGDFVAPVVMPEEFSGPAYGGVRFYTLNSLINNHILCTPQMAKVHSLLKVYCKQNLRTQSTRYLNRTFHNFGRLFFFLTPLFTIALY